VPFQSSGLRRIATGRVKLRPGENIKYVITEAGCKVPNDRVRGYSLWEDWHGYDRAKYATMMREAFEPFEHPCRVTR
jgi:hypothetical protein